MRQTRLDQCAIDLCARHFHWRKCDHWKANLFLVIGSAIAVAVSMRYMLGALLLVIPLDSAAGQLVLKAWLIGDGIFFTSAAIATFGGATSLLRELRADPQSFSIIGALGHMFSAQFAGLLAFLGCMYVGVPEWPSLLAVGMAGWAGNAWLVRFDKWTSNRVFPGSHE